MNTITAEQRAELIRRLRDDEAAGAAAPGIALAVIRCGMANGDDCDLCANLYEMEFEPEFERPPDPV